MNINEKIRKIKESLGNKLFILGHYYQGRVSVRHLHRSLCPDMTRTNERNLLKILEQWPAENEIHVPEDFKPDARRALNRMLSL